MTADWTTTMAISTFGSFEAAKSGLSVSMQQLNVTEQNISNVNTEGYTRQRILTSAKEPASSTYLIAQLKKNLVGQGVEATGIQQIRSEYLDTQYRAMNTNYNYSSSRSNAMEYMTGLFNELNDDGSITSSIGSFFSALNTFSSDTSSKEYRTNVQQQALSMTASFNNVYEEMQSLWHDQNDSIATTANKINSIAKKIASLNDTIAKAEQTVGSANDLNDERNLLLDQLSGYTNISYKFNSSNKSMIDVSIGGVSLVDGKTSNTIVVDQMANHQTEINNALNDIATYYNSSVALEQAARDSASTKLTALGFTCTPTAGGYDVSYKGVSLVTGNTMNSTIENAAATNLTIWTAYNRNNLTIGTSALDIGGAVTGGQLYSNMEMITSQGSQNPGIPYFMDQLNSFVKELAKNLNDIVSSGWTYPDGATPSQQGINLFKVTNIGTPASPVYDYSTMTAGNFTLSDEVMASAYNIAGSSTQVVLGASSTESGNNEIALKMFQDLSKSSYYDKLNSIVGNLGIAANTTDSIESTKKSLLKSIDTQRQSISAVSLDEETTNLIIYQQSYQACSRIISTLDEMLDTLINTMGR